MNIFDEVKTCDMGIEREMRDTVMLLKKKLAKMNDLEVDDIDDQELDNFKDIYKTFYYIDSIYKSMSH